jgi:O-succinylbenzoate synthase
MRVERVELRVIEMELVEPFETSFGREEMRPAILISAVSEGVVGWGECVAGSGPWYSYETIKTARHVLEDFLIPSVLGRESPGLAEMISPWRRVRGHPMAKAGLEAALWDLAAKREGVSLSQMLGGTKERIESGISIGIQSDLPMLLRAIERRLEEGYRRVKLKIKPGWDINVLQAVRERFPQIPLMADANAAYVLDDIRLLKQLDEYALMMIEQPFSYDDLVDHAELQKQITTPVCLDESIKAPEDARRALQLGSCRVINLKPGRVGGLSAAKQIHDFCLERDIPIWCGGMLETGIGRAHNVALASLPGFTLPNDLSASRRYYVEDLIEPPVNVTPEGTIEVPRSPGIGVAVLEERLKKHTLQHEAFDRLVIR